MGIKNLVKLAILAALPLALGLSAGAPSTPGYRFTMDAGPYAEAIGGWMAQNTAAKVQQSATVAPASTQEDQRYFSLMGRFIQLSRSAAGDIESGQQAESPSPELFSLQSEMEALRPRVEASIQRQIGAALDQAGLAHGIAGGDLLFPPVLFRFESPPYLLVVSPRDRIEQTATVLLRPDMTLAEAEQLEDTVTKQGYSALVTGIGGLGVYPSVVPESSDAQWTLRTVAHEWAHQFLAFRPLGWRYAFGAEADNRMVAVNETTADILGREIGDRVYQQYYSKAADGISPPSSPSGDDFRKSMRAIRTRVDALLAQGKVDEAESYMESARQQLARQGYLIRKLNQAYFAFYGSYSDELSLGGAQGDEVGALLHQLRDRSSSLGDFLWRASSIGSYDDLRRLAGGQ